jgi:predicted lipid-binding transport protein (Tim44 family)
VTGIIIFGLAAIFLGLRLYSVLGKRTGHEQSFVAPEDAKRPPMAEVPTGETPRDTASSGEVAEPVVESDEAARGLRAIAAADRTFTPEEFVGGAQAAYRMILEAFWSGDMKPVAPYVTPDVLGAFEDAIAARTEAGEVVDNRLIQIERAVIEAASLSDGVAHITVRFDADIAAVTHDKDGNLIAGSLTDAVAANDAWTFHRDIRGRDPNWILADTDDAE